METGVATRERAAAFLASGTTAWAGRPIGCGMFMVMIQSDTVSRREPASQSDRTSWRGRIDPELATAGQTSGPHDETMVGLRRNRRDL